MKIKKIILSAAMASILVLQSTGAVYAADTSVSSDYNEGEEELTHMGMTMEDESESDTSDSDFDLHGSGTSTATIRSSNYETLTGIDVSHWQGTIDWSSVADDGIEFAVIKATGRGTTSGSLYTDGQLTTNLDGAISAGIPVGVYCFSQAITEEEAIEEANYTCDKISGYSLSLPVFIDYEYTSGYRLDNGASVETRTNIIDAFCSTVAARGYTPGVYSGGYLLATAIDGASLAEDYTMWVASYSSSIRYYTGVYDMWQYSSSGSVDGISTGSTDMDYWYKSASDSTSGSQAMYRLYNRSSGEHFYTADTNERDYLKKLGWVYEGVGWYAPTTGTAVYRLYNPNTGDHHYTKNSDEKDYLVTLGWNYEKIGWYSADSSGTPVYRDYNPNATTGTHNYTTSESEHNNLVNLGWKAEGIGWYGI